MYRWRCRARGVQREDHRAPGRPAHQLVAVEPQPAADPESARRHQAAARDFRRRRQVRAWRHRRTARQRGSVLSDQPRAFRRCGAQPSHLCVRRRDHRPHPRCLAQALARARRGRTNRRRAMTAIEAALKSRPTPAFPVERIRADFPILKLEIGGKPLVYLDNAASSQMPQPVIDRLVRYQTTQHANVNRGVHYLSETATAAYEEARDKARHFINAREEREVIFTSGTTDAINLVTHAFGRKFIGPGDEIILTTLEHHSNIVPWQMLAEEKGAKIRVVPINDSGELLVDEYEKLFNAHTKFVGLIHVSNALGTVNPIKRMIAFAHARGMPVLIDG